MTTSESLLIPFFDRFIRATKSGRRLKPDGSRIKQQSIANYNYTVRYLREFETLNCSPLRISLINGSNQRVFLRQKKYWQQFYREFTEFLYRKGCHDNYVGMVIKTIRVFFNYLEKDIGMKTGGFHRNFYVCREEIPIITLLPDQLRFLINDEQFDKTLSPALKKSKDIFVLGCTVALRVSDLFATKFTDIQAVGSSAYLKIKTLKTGTAVNIKLPAYALTIVQRFKQQARRRKQIFPPIPRTRFNDHIKEICARAGYTNELGRERARRGILIDTLGDAGKGRFCDLISSHAMRRTAITTMLMLGVKEHVVRQISGHAANSKSFYRYVNLAQSYLDAETDKAFNQLVWSQ